MLARYERGGLDVDLLGGAFCYKAMPFGLSRNHKSLLILFNSLDNFEAIKGKSKGLDLKMGEVLGWEGRIWLM